MLEVGPGQTLASLVRQHALNNAKVFSSMRRREETVRDTAFVLSTLGQLWIAGQSVDWSARHVGETVTRIPLPTYPFERQRFWIDPDDFTPAPTAVPVTRAVPVSAPLGVIRGDKPSPSQESIERWFYQRQWSRTEQPTADLPERICWLIFLDPVGLGKQITVQLRGAEHEVVQVTPGAGYKRIGRGEYTIRPGERVDYDALLADLTRRTSHPKKIVHLWSIGDELARPSLDDQLNRSFYSLMFLAQALGDHALSGTDIAVVSDRLHSVKGEPILDPVCATLLGPARVIPKEFPGITCRNVDLDLKSQGLGPAAVQVVTEHCSRFNEAVVAFRDGERWTESLEQIDLPATSEHQGFRQRGVYLITGGLGDLGLVIAEELARNCKARLVLVGRTPFPSAAQWKSLIEAAETPAHVLRQIRKLIQIQALGAEVLVLTGDVSQREAMRRVIDNARARFGSIDGVIHTAGVLDDGPLQLKTRESAARVLEPKVQGTLVLNEVFQQARQGEQPSMPLDFFVLFSSVSSLLAPPGQADYAAANAFLDAFAVSQSSNTRTVAINWGAWRDVGMAARITASNPLLGQRLVDTADEIVYAVPLSYNENWVLAEHRMQTGRALLPGTSYLEMARAAIARVVRSGRRIRGCVLPIALHR